MGIGNITDEEKFKNLYILQSPSKLLKTKFGTCFDQVEYERKFFNNNDIDDYTIYMEMDNEEKANHSFLVFTINKEAYLFEHADQSNKGIHQVKDINDAISRIKKRMEKQYSEYGYKVQYFSSYPKPEFGIGYKELLNFIYDSKNLI